MKKIRTAIIGIGKVTPLHVNALKNLKQSEFVAVCSRDMEKARKFADDHQINAYNDIHEMIVDSKVDMVSICTPHPVHKNPALKAINAGAHVLVEKPLAISLDDCDEMINAAKKKNVTLGVISQRRFYPGVIRLKNAIEEGKIGKPVLGIVNMLGWRDENYYKSDPWRGSWEGEGGGVLVNQSPHQIDLLQWFMGPIDELYGYWANFNHSYIEVEDTAVAVIKFKNGALGNIVVTNSCNPGLHGKVHVHGGNGASIGVQTDGGMMFIAGMSSITEPPYNDLWTIKGEEHLLEVWKKEDTDHFNKIHPAEYYIERQYDDFLNAIIHGKKPLVTGEDARITVEIFTAIYRSNRDKLPVKFPLKPENKNDFDGRFINK